MKRFLLVAALTLAACQAPDTQTAVVATPRTDALAANPVEFVLKHAEREVFHGSIEDALNHHPNLTHASALRKLYATRDFQPLWLAQERPLNDAGESLLAALLDAEPVHGLWREDFHLDAIQALVAPTPPVEDFSVVLSPTALTELRAWEQLHVDSSASDWSKRVLSAAPEVRRAVDARRGQLLRDAAERAQLEVLLSDALGTYGAQMRWTNAAWGRSPDWKGTLEGGNFQTPEMVTQLAPVFTSADAVHGVLRDVRPPFQAYRDLTQSFQTYTDIVVAGGWDQLGPDVKGLKPGKRGPAVVALKERLRAEGYWGEENTDHYGPLLMAAVKSYQQSHQLWEDGWVTDETFASLNVPAQRRLNQIRVTLDRWRQSRLGHDKTFVHVNIPDFHAEFWRNGALERRTRVVTGAARQKWNPNTRRNEFVNATPTLSSRMDFVVFNPYWNVPHNIRKTEIEPKIAKDPDYMDEQGFEVITDTNGYEFMRQKPGPKNALGAVKFLFPNDHDVYLHDTPDKEYFKWPTRAFSHGCVRVENPMDLAQWVLDGEGKWDEATVNAWYERDGETWIKLDQPVPVHVEYFVVRVDELGRTNFLADVYLNDQPRLAEVDARLRLRAQKADKDG